MSDADTGQNPAPTPVVPQTPSEPTSLVGVPMPAELVQADPGILVESIRGNGQPPETRHLCQLGRCLRIVPPALVAAPGSHVCEGQVVSRW